MENFTFFICAFFALMSGIFCRMATNNFFLGLLTFTVLMFVLEIFSWLIKSIKDLAESLKNKI